MIYGSVSSGIECAAIAWKPLGWKPAFLAEIDPFASTVLHHHHSSGRPRFMPAPEAEGLTEKARRARRAAIKVVQALPERANGAPNYGDMTTFEEWPDAAIDLLVGGTPCQTYSVAGLRAGLDDPRGDLTLTYAAIARRFRPRWLVWENVYGVLSHDGGRSFASLLGLLSGRRVEVPAGGWKSAGIVEGYERAYGLAWRVLDTQYVRVDGFGRARPQRRRRVFVVGYLGDWRRAAAVLLELEGLSGNPAPRRRSQEDIAGTLAGGARVRGGYSADDIPLTAEAFGGNRTSGPIDVATALTAHGGPAGRMDFESETFVAPEVAATLDASFGRLQGASGQDMRHGHSHLVATAGKVAPALTGNPYGDHESREDLLVAHTLRADGFDASEHGTGRGTPIVPIAFNSREDPEVTWDRTGPLGASSPQAQAIAYGIRNDAARSGEAKTPSADAAGKVRLRAPGFNVCEEFSPTLDTGTAHTVAYGVDPLPFDTTQITSASNYSSPKPGDPCHPLAAQAHPPAIAWSIMPQNSGRDYKAREVEVAQPLMAGGPVGGNQGGDYIQTGWAVRRLTPRECCRLQGVPDDYFDEVVWRGSSPPPDGPIYKTLGNGFSANVVRWIGRRIEMVEALGLEISREAAE